MSGEIRTVEEYIARLPEERRRAVAGIRDAILENLPGGFEELISYRMIGYVVPHTVYPAGYHPDPSLPLPFINLASQRHHVALYHMGLYADPGLLEWFLVEYGRVCSRKPDMGKSCVRFRKMEGIPFGLIGELAGKMAVHEWVALYEARVKR